MFENFTTEGLADELHLHVEGRTLHVRANSEVSAYSKIRHVRNKLLSLLNDSDDPTLRKDLIKVLGLYGGESEIDPLKAELIDQSNDEDIVRETLCAIMAIGGKKASEVLRGFSHESAALVRTAKSCLADLETGGIYDLTIGRVVGASKSSGRSLMISEVAQFNSGSYDSLMRELDSIDPSGREDRNAILGRY